MPSHEFYILLILMGMVCLICAGGLTFVKSAAQIRVILLVLAFTFMGLGALALSGLHKAVSQAVLRLK